MPLNNCSQGRRTSWEREEEGGNSNYSRKEEGRTFFKSLIHRHPMTPHVRQSDGGRYGGPALRPYLVLPPRIPVTSIGVIPLPPHPAIPRELNILYHRTYP